MTDEHGHEVAEVPLAADRARSIRSWSWLPNFPVWSMVAVAIVVLAVTTVLIENRGIYQTASAPSNGAVVALRFVVQATAADITSFLETYQASIIGEPRGVGFYRVRMSDAKLSQQDLSKLVARMAQEQIVEFVAVQQ